MTNRSLRQPRRSSAQLLARMLDEPSLVTTVQRLTPHALGKIIQHVGLEDCGEILSLATTEQLRRVFDEDLWRSDRPGRDEVFDADRFALWLEVMLEAGEDFVAEKLADLPEDLVTMGLHRRILVLDMDQLATEAREDGERLDKALEGCLREEFDAYQVIARRHDGWDSIVAVLTALDKHDHALLDRLLARCCSMSSETIDDNGGLYEVLTSEEMLEGDLAADREDRRAAEGFIAPSQATSFLAMCRTTSPQEIVLQPRDAVTRAYFRELVPATDAAGKGASNALPAPDASARLVADLERLLAELDTEDRPPDARPALLLTERAGAGNPMALFRTALATLLERDPKLHGLRLEELAYLTNVIVAGCSLDGRAFRPFEAVVAVAAVCNLGLERLAPGTGGNAKLAERAVTVLAREGADKAFRAGWWTLHHEVSLPTCAALARAFARSARQTRDRELRHRYERSARFVDDTLAQGRPTLARQRLSDLDVDDARRAALDGLLGECPVLVGALGGANSSLYSIDRDSAHARAKRGSGLTRRHFVGSNADLISVRAFLDALSGPASVRRRR